MVLAINEGQVHRYIEKPWDVERLQRDAEAGLEAYRNAVCRADRVSRLEARSRTLEKENLQLKDRIDKLGLDDIITANREMKNVLRTAEKLARASDAVLIYGESGTGKELVARRIHAVRHGKSAPFVPLNCGALSEALVESELFGHCKGAFTGAVSDFPGAFERANGGTVFLDEIGDLKQELQVKLLRVLEESTVRRVGGKSEIPVRASVLAASHRNLRDMVVGREFREDLYFRLSVIEIRLPPLRERPEDIPLLAEHFLKQARLAYDRPGLCFTPEALEAIGQLPLPGNVRELRNVVRRAAVIAVCDEVGLDEIENIAIHRGHELLGLAAADGAASPDGELAASKELTWSKESDSRELKKAREEAVADVDRAFLEYWHRCCRGNIAEMARSTGLSRSHLYRMARRSGFDLTGAAPFDEK
jgi:two-component system response regulator PilR (NtrC family)